MDSTIKEISLLFGKDVRVVKLICEHPLLFSVNRIRDPEDIRPIMIQYFGKFVFKSTKTKEDKKRNTDKFNERKAIANQV